MTDQIKNPTLAQLHRAIREKERELSDLDLILADYHMEHSQLIRQLRQLKAQLRDAEEAASLNLET